MEEASDGRFPLSAKNRRRRSGYCPKGLWNSAQGFNPGNRRPRTTRPEAKRRQIERAKKHGRSLNVLTEHRLEAYACSIGLPDCRAISLNHPGSFRRAPGLARRRRKVANAHAIRFKGLEPILHLSISPSLHLSVTPSLRYSISVILASLKPHSRAGSCTHSSSNFRY
jgi:hypothetical protein